MLSKLQLLTTVIKVNAMRRLSEGLGVKIVCVNEQLTELIQFPRTHTLKVVVKMHLQLIGFTNVNSVVRVCGPIRVPRWALVCA